MAEPAPVPDALDALTVNPSPTTATGVDDEEDAVLDSPAPKLPRPAVTLAASGDDATGDAAADDVDMDDDGAAEAEAAAPDAPAAPVARAAVGRSRGGKAAGGASRARLAASIDAQLAVIRTEQARSQRARLRFLMGSSDVFSHFMKDMEGGGKLLASPSGKGKAATAAGGSARVARAASRTAIVDEDASAAAGGAAGEDAEEGMPAGGTRLEFQPSCITGSMREYQLEGLNWLLSLHDNGINGILADEMGLGKTLQTISLLGYLKECAGIVGPSLILVPKSTLSNWLNEIARWCPALTAIKLHGGAEERSVVIRSKLQPGIVAEERGWNVLVTTYEVACIESTVLSRIAWQYIIIDEAHRIKNENSKLSTVVRGFTSAHRLLITGTPLQNNLHELWALLNFLLPDLFGSSAAFDEWFNLASTSADEEAKAATVKQLHRVLRPFMLRRMKADVAKALPPKRETMLYVGMTRMQREWYKSILMRDIDAVLGARGGARTRLSNLIMHLRKVCNHPYLFEGAEDRTLDPLGEHVVFNCAKLQLLDKLLPRLKERGSRVLLFSQMTSLLDIIEDYCRIRSYEYCRIDGNSGYDEREEAIDSYNAPGSSKFIFLLSTRAGGLGINLATADIVILYDSDWNPQADLQAQDRAHRIGQTKPVQVYRLVTSGSVEEKIVERALVKLKLDAVVVQQGRLADKHKGLTKEEMAEMIQFGADNVIKTGSGDPNAMVTDADVDEILRMGEARTKDLTATLAKKAGDLLDFSVGTGTAQVFEGVDYSTLAARKREKEAEAARTRALRMAIAQSMNGTVEQRRPVTTSTTLSASEEAVLRALQMGGMPGTYARDAARLRAHLPADHRPPSRMDPWMFIDKPRVMEITAMEIAHLQAVHEVRVAAAEKEGAPPPPVDPSAIPPEAQFSPELVDERAGIIARGFPSWRKHDFSAFVRACATHGRRDHASIRSEMRKLGKPDEEVKRYIVAFWTVAQAYLAPHEWTRVCGIIRRGEAALVDMHKSQAALACALARTVTGYASHVFSHLGDIGTSPLAGAPPKDVPPAPAAVTARVRDAADPWSNLSIVHTHSRSLAYDMWTRASDATLLSQFAMTGNSETLPSALLNNPYTRFDIYARSRSAADCDARVRVLLKASEKDVQDAYRRGDRDRHLLGSGGAAGAVPVAAPVESAVAAASLPLHTRRANEDAIRRRALAAALKSRSTTLHGHISAAAAAVAAVNGMSAAHDEAAGAPASDDESTSATAAASKKPRMTSASSAPVAAAGDKRGRDDEEDATAAGMKRARAATDESDTAAGVKYVTGYASFVVGGDILTSSRSSCASAFVPALIAHIRAHASSGMAPIVDSFADALKSFPFVVSGAVKSPTKKHLQALLQVLAVKKSGVWVVHDHYTRFAGMTYTQAAEALRDAPIELRISKRVAADAPDAPASSTSDSTAASAAVVRSVMAAMVAPAVPVAAAPVASPPPLVSSSSGSALMQLTAARGLSEGAVQVDASVAAESGEPVHITPGELQRWKETLRAARNQPDANAVCQMYCLANPHTPRAVVLVQMAAIAQRVTPDNGPSDWLLKPEYAAMLPPEEGAPIPAAAVPAAEA